MEKRQLQKRRAYRTRYVLKKNNSRPRLSVFRSGHHIYAQIIDDVKGVTLVSQSSLDKELRSGLTSTSNKEAAAAVGKALSAKALSSGIKTVVFDRGGYLYHGRVRELAEAARAGGLEF